MDILIHVNKQRLKLPKSLNNFVSGTQQFIRFIFDLSSDWDNLRTFAQFIQNGTAYSVYLDENNSVYLPSEIQAGKCTLMLYGTGDTIRATTDYISLDITPNILVQNASSTEITQSLYDQLVLMVNEVLDLSNSDYSELITTQIDSILAGYLEDGSLAAATIEDGSIPRSKVNAAFEATLAKADTAMQPTVYDPVGYGTRTTPIDPYSFAQAQDTETINKIRGNNTGGTIEAFVVTDSNNVSVTYSGLDRALNGILTRAGQYSNALLNNYSPFYVEIVNELPETGVDRTFYLIPKESGNGYDKYWYITDENNNMTWDGFGASSTVIVTELPAVGEPDVDYILSANGEFQYYKYINSNWELIAGNSASIIAFEVSTEIIGSGPEPPSTAAYPPATYRNKYYLCTGTMTLYSSNGSSWSTTGSSLINNPSSTKDYYVKDETGTYGHYRYISNCFKQIGSSSYTRSQVDTMISTISSSIDSLRQDVEGDIDTIDAKVDALGNLVTDVSGGYSGLTVSYKDGTSKSLDVSNPAATVEDVDALEGNTGIRITYTDGDTKDIEIAGGGGTSTSGSASITRVTNAATQCVYGETCNIQYTFAAYDSAGDIVGDGIATWYVNNVKKATSSAAQGITNAFNIGPYLNVGTNTVKISISVDTGGETRTVTTKTWTVNAINLYLTWEYDDTTVNTADTVAIRWTPYGDLSKVTHFIIDDVEDNSLQNTTTRSGVQQYVAMDKLSHGSHMVEVYLTATVNGTAIRSASVFHDMIFADSGSNTPVISCSVSQTTMVQYNTMRIPIVVYNPASLTSTVVLAEDGTTIATWTGIDRSVHYWNYTPTTYGTKVLTITCGSTTKTIILSVTELDIDNEEVTGYAFRMKASDIAGNSALQAWSSNGVTATFSNNFDWNNGGIKTETDSSGNAIQYICVKAGTTMTINYELFGNDAKVNGKNFKVIFKTANCRDYDATWLDCLSDGIGISLGANSGTASSEQNTVDVKYAEGSYTEFEYDIYPDNLTSTDGNAMRYIQTYIDGVLSSTSIYAANDNFTQTIKKNIVIGSDDCDVYIYMVKVYETYITRENHVINFIADAPNAVEMVERYNRNDILAENGEIDYQKLANQNPNCRVHLWDIPRMTQNKMKKDPVPGCSYQQIYVNGSERDQLTAENVTIGVQGTSSVNYISSAANIDGNFTEGFTDGNGTHLNGYSMSENSIPVNYFNVKVNVASCENINNMCIAEWYDAHQPYVTGARANVENARDCMEHHIGVQFIRDRHEDNEPASAALFTDIDPDGDNYHMYAICNMGNSKENGAVFHDANNPLECCVETKDNNSAICMMTAQLTAEDLDSEDYFEFRYPKHPTTDMKTAFINFVNWMCSRNPAAYTGNALAQSVTYPAYTFKGTSSWDENEQTEVLAGLTISDYAGTYTHDTYEYRMARLLDECENHLVMDSIVYHYVFVEQHAMVDNVCKNTFWGTDDLVHWHLCKNYDNDTADGNNNTGKLTIPFGAEGMDTISGGDVFNGKMNVYWQFIYGLYPARKLMWQNREAAGTWNADAYLQFATGWQNYLPERVYNQDYWYKYLRPYEQNADTQYITMLEGGKKNHQREGFVRNNLTYMASQYTGTYCTSDSITVRAYTPGVSADMTPAQAAIINATITAVPPNPVVQVMLYNKGYVVVEVASVMKRVKAEKGVWYTIDFSESSSSMNDTVVNIHGASNVRAIGDMSSLYIKFCNFSKASKLRSLQIGSNVSGYTNLGLESVGFESNPMLEELYVQNCPNSTSTLDLSGCQSLRTLDVRGSGFTGINFAVGGLIETAYLCSPASLTMRSLYYLTDENLSLESYGNLTTIRFEDTPGVNSLALVNAATNLSRARITGINWTLTDTTKLNYFLTLMGLDESDHNLETSVLSGQAYVSGAIRNQEILNYSTAWPNLTVGYNPNNLVTQFLVTYVNADSNHTTLYQCYVDQGAAPPNPVTAGLISAPTLPPTAQYVYTYTGWDDVTSQVFAPKTITAVYTQTVRTYTVTWYSRSGLPIETQSGLEYGAAATYTGSTPTWTDGEGSYIFHIFTGWDKSTGYITGDLDVYAVWDTANGLPASGTDMSEMTPAQIYGVGYAEQQDNYFEDGDYVDITLGHDFDFSNVDSIEIGKDVALTGVAVDRFVSGGYYFDGSTAYTTNIKLFDEDSPAFTMAIDFQFNTSTSGATLMSTHAGGSSEGFRLYYNGSAHILQWGDQSVIVGYAKYRDIVVLRHPKGSKYLYVYAAGNLNTQRFTDSVVKTPLLRSAATETDEPISFGGINYPSGYRNYGKGTIHWCKIWLDDIGDECAYALAAWPREKIRMEYWGEGKYYCYENGEVTNNTTKASFICNSAVGNVNGRGYWMNTTNVSAGGWKDSKMRTFLNTRFFDALPTVWQSLIETVEIVSTIGNQSTSVQSTPDKIYLPSYREVGSGTTATGLIEEVGTSTDPISWFSSDTNRLKWRGKTRRYGNDVTYYECATEPAALYQIDIEPGTIWKKTDTSYCYMFISQAEISQYGITADYTADSNYALGGWVLASHWWERSPYLTGSTNFMFVGITGAPGNSYSGASGSYGVVPGFSI